MLAPEVALLRSAGLMGELFAFYTGTNSFLSCASQPSGTHLPLTPADELNAAFSLVAPDVEAFLDRIEVRSSLNGLHGADAIIDERSAPS